MAALCCLLLLVSTTSCKKDDIGDAAKFAGTWVGTSTCTSDTTIISMTLTAVAGSKVTFTNNLATATYPALKSVTVTATAKGDNLTFPTQSFSDNTGSSITLSGNGSLSNGTLTIYQEYSGYINTACTFTGHK